MKATVNIIKEYWIEGTSSCMQVDKNEFNKLISVGFRGFLLYENGFTYWVKK